MDTDRVDSSPESGPRGDCASGPDGSGSGRDSRTNEAPPPSPRSATPVRPSVEDLSPPRSCFDEHRTVGWLFIVFLFSSILVGLWLVATGVPTSTAKKTGEKAGMNLSWLTGEDKGLAIVKIYGTIELKEDKYSLGRGGDGVVQQIKKLRKDSRVKALVLRINSPGGTIGASQEIHNVVKEAAESIPVVVSMGDVAASGGYYVACPATYIFANPGTITGSIGVITQLVNFEVLLSKVGLTMPTFKSGEHKDMGSGHRMMTEKEKGLFQGIISGAYEQFLDAVYEGRVVSLVNPPKGRPAAGRKQVLKTKDELRKVADGRVYLGTQALECGLVDELGGVEAAVKKAAALAGLGETPKIIKASSANFEELIDSLIPDGLAHPVSEQVSAIMGPRPPVMYLYQPGL